MIKEKLNRGFEQIYPDTALDETRIRRAASLSDEELESIFETTADKTDHFQRNVSVIAVFAALLLICCSFIAFNNTGYDRVIIRVNPEIVLKVRNNTVTKIKAKNRDAVEIIEGIEVPLDLDTALDKVITKIDEKGYFDVEGNELSITVKGRKKDLLEKQICQQTQIIIGEMDKEIPVKVGDSTVIIPPGEKKKKNDEKSDIDKSSESATTEKDVVITTEEKTVSTEEITTEEITTEATMEQEREIDKEESTNDVAEPDTAGNSGDSSGQGDSVEPTTNEATTEAPVDKESKSDKEKKDKKEKKEKKQKSEKKEKKEKSNNKDKEKNSNNGKKKDK